MHSFATSNYRYGEAVHPTLRFDASRIAGIGFGACCVIQVVTGRERRTAERISEAVPYGFLQECFFPQYTTEIKVKGQWVLTNRPMLPGYLIAVTEEPYILDRELKKLGFPARLLSQNNVFLPLDRSYVNIIDSCTEPGHRIVPMSRGFKDGDTVMINQGPLVGQQVKIKRINRRKSTALVEFNLCGRIVSARMGLALISLSNGDCM